MLELMLISIVLTFLKAVTLTTIVSSEYFVQSFEEEEGEDEDKENKEVSLSEEEGDREGCVVTIAANI